MMLSTVKLEEQLSQEAPLVRYGNATLHGGCPPENCIELVLETKLLLLEIFDFRRCTMLDVSLDVLDLLVEFVMTVEELHKMPIGAFEFGNEFAVFGEHDI